MVVETCKADLLLMDKNKRNAGRFSIPVVLIKLLKKAGLTRVTWAIMIRTQVVTGKAKTNSETEVYSYTKKKKFPYNNFTNIVFPNISDDGTLREIDADITKYKYIQLYAFPLKRQGIDNTMCLYFVYLSYR